MISNQEYEAAWNDRDNRRVMEGVCRTFPGLTRDERTYHMQAALLRCLTTFDPKYGQKFTTSLHLFTRWECLRGMRAAKRGRGDAPLPDDVAAPVHERSGDLDHIRECVGMLSEEDRDYVVLRHYEGMTFREVGRARGCGKDTARARVRAAEGRLRDLYLAP